MSLMKIAGLKEIN